MRGAIWATTPCWSGKKSCSMGFHWVVSCQVQAAAPVRANLCHHAVIRVIPQPAFSTGNELMGTAPRTNLIWTASILLGLVMIWGCSAPGPKLTPAEQDEANHQAVLTTIRSALAAEKANNHEELTRLGKEYNDNLKACTAYLMTLDDQEFEKLAPQMKQHAFAIAAKLESMSRQAGMFFFLPSGNDMSSRSLEMEFQNRLGAALAKQPQNEQAEPAK